MILCASLAFAKLDADIYDLDMFGDEFLIGFDNKKFVKTTWSTLFGINKMLVTAAALGYGIAKIMIFLGGF